MLLKFGELALKGRNRPQFVGALERNLRRAADLGPLEVRHRGGVFIVTGGEPQDELVRALPRAAGGERGAAGAALRARPDRRGRRRRGAPARPGRPHLRGARPAARQALRAALDRAGARDRRRRAGAARAGGGPLEPGPRAVRRGRPQGAARVGGPAARSRRAARRVERQRARAALGRPRLARGRLPDDEARPALRLRALLGPPLHRARLDLQGVRAGGAPRPLPGRLAAVRRHVRRRRSGGSRRPAPGVCRCCRSGG